jgi:hypothetical protein
MAPHPLELSVSFRVEPTLSPSLSTSLAGLMRRRQSPNSLRLTAIASIFISALLGSALTAIQLLVGLWWSTFRTLHLSCLPPNLGPFSDTPLCCDVDQQPPPSHGSRPQLGVEPQCTIPLSLIYRQQSCGFRRGKINRWIQYFLETRKDRKISPPGHYLIK